MWYDRYLVRIVLLRLAGKTPEKIPLDMYVVVLSPAQKVNVLNGPDTLAHETNTLELSDSMPGWI